MEAKCPYFGRCGGCSNQNVSYETQLKNKKEFLLNKFRKAGIEIPSEIQVFSDKPYNYRNRMDFASFAGGIGLREKDTYHRIIKVRRCEISNEKLNKLLSEVWKWFDTNKQKIDAFDIKNKTGTLRYALIRASEFSDSSAISFALNADSSKQAEHIEMIKDFAKQTSAENVVISRVPKQIEESISNDYFPVKGDVMLNEVLLGKKLVFHSQGFFQNNSIMAEKMVNYAKSLLSKYSTKDSSLLDLYGGVGTFGINIADIFKDCLIVESVKESIDCAKTNIRENNVKNADAIVMDASTITTKKMEGKMKGKNLFVITDPPRTGMHIKTIRYLIEAKPEVIIYISCNPSQIAKEMITLKNKYSINSLAMFDLFPQTNHIEAIAELKKI